MSKIKLQKTRSMNRILIVACSLVGVYTLVNMISIQYDISQKNKMIEDLTESKIQQQNINDELSEILVEGVTDEAIIEVAQNKLGLALPGERVVEDVGSK